MERQSARWVGIVLVLLGGASYGMLSPMVKLSYEMGFQSIQVSVSQVTMGTMLLWLGIAVRPKLWSNPFRGPWWQLSLIGVFGLVLTTFLFNKALDELNASLAIVLLFQFTWITMILDSIVHRTRPTRYQLTAVGFILLGTICAVGLSREALFQQSVQGIVLALGAAITYSLFLFFTGKIKTELNPWMKTAVMSTAALPVMYLMYPPTIVFTEGMGALLLWGIALGLLSQVIPVLSFNIGIPRIGGTLASLLASVELPVGMIVAWLLLKEWISPLQWAGMLLILSGIYIAERRSNKGGGMSG
jgi:drug/metabolite transporter (DMT)-like permease